jgi:hypothetical protein
MDFGEWISFEDSWNYQFYEFLRIWFSNWFPELILKLWESKQEWANMFDSGIIELVKRNGGPSAILGDPMAFEWQMLA